MNSTSKERWGLPDSWVWTTLSELGQIVAGGTPSTKEPGYWGNEVNWISPADLTGHSAKTIRKGAKSISMRGLAHSSAKMIPAGSVHFSSRAPIGYVVISSEPIATNQGFKSLVPAPGVFNEYVYHYLKASKTFAQQSASGTTFLELSGRAFANLRFPLAPTAQQRRIVTKIEELLSELDKSVHSLKTTQEQLKVYRHAVLRHAFSAKLTAQWRAEHKSALETAEQLRIRIKAQRETRHQDDLAEWKIALQTWDAHGKKQKKPSRPSKPAALPELSPSEEALLPSLPAEWAALRLGLVVDEPQYGTSKKCHYDFDGIGVLRIPNVVGSVVDASDLKGAAFDAYEVSAYRLRKGDILIIRSNGSISIVGKCALASEKDEQYLYAGYLIRIRPHPEVILPAYLVALISSHLLRAQIESKAKSTSGVNNINSSELQSLVIPICSIKEQEQVVERLSTALSTTGAIEAEIEQQLERAEALRHSILKRAFSGRLVEQDDDDEPASILLERLKTEKARMSGAGKRTKKRTTAA